MQPLYMPPDLLKAHQHLDALVDKLYGRKFANDAGIHRPSGRSRSEALDIMGTIHFKPYQALWK